MGSSGGTTGSGGGTTGSGGGTTGSSGSTTSSGGSTTGSGGDAGAPDAYAQSEKFCDAVVGPVCDAYFACCTIQHSLDTHGGTVENCKTKLALECRTTLTVSFIPQIEAGNTVLDEARLAACVADLKAMATGGGACSSPPMFKFELDCIAAFRGTIAPGGACDGVDLHDTDFIPCRGGSCEENKCRPFLKSGDACDPTSISKGSCNFVEGEWCIGSGTNARCAPRAAIGEDCADPNHDKAFTCISMSCGPDGKCIAPTVFGRCSEG